MDLKCPKCEKMFKTKEELVEHQKHIWEINLSETLMIHLKCQSDLESIHEFRRLAI